MNVAGLGDTLREKVGAQQMLQQQQAEAENEARILRQTAAHLEHVVALLAAMQDVWAERFQAAVGKVVSQGLTGVFGEPLELVVEMGTQADLPVARFAVRDSRGLETGVMDARGGGLVNVTAFLLRVLLLLSARPPLARLLFLDESFANVSEEYVPALVALLRRICEEGGFQIVLISHRAELVDAGDVVYEFRLEDGVTQVRRLKLHEVAEAGP